MGGTADYRPESLQGVQRLHQLGDAAPDLLPLVPQVLELARQGLRLPRIRGRGPAMLLGRLQLLLEVLQPGPRLAQLVLQVPVLLAQALHQLHRLADLVLEKLEVVLHGHSPRISAPRARSAAATASSDDWTSSPVRVREGSW